MNNVVSIPKGYFFKQSKNEYSDYRTRYRTRLVQEIVQNAYDAGATEIYLDFYGEGYTIQDNGCGMSRETMVEGLLTMGGSKKEGENNTGGFGHAKVLILFSMDSYYVESNGIRADGEVLHYGLKEIPFRRGTIVSGKFPSEWNADKDRMANIAREFLSKCHLLAKVYVNGEEFTNWLVAHNCNCVRTLSWAHLFSQKQDVNNYYIKVRKNGLYMFSTYTGQAVEKEIILEITADSKEVLTANRDGLKGDYAKEFQALCSEIAVDKNSFDRKSPAKKIFKGEREFNLAEFKEQMGELDNQIKNLLEQVKTLAGEGNLEGLQGLRSKAYTFTNPLATEVVEKAIDFIQTNLKTDFVVDLADSDLLELPKRLNPKTMAVTNQTIAKLWRAALETVFEANEMHAQFRIGFTLNKDRKAHYQMVNNVEEYLINPEADFWEWEKAKRITQLLILACHEVTHRSREYHDEYFVAEEEKLLVKTLVFIKGDVHEITKKAKHITL
jgi:hypothetical protein